MTTLAGSGSSTYADGQGSYASFIYPYGVAVNFAGVIYVTDNNNHRIRQVSPTGKFYYVNCMLVAYFFLFGHQHSHMVALRLSMHVFAVLCYRQF